MRHLLTLSTLFAAACAACADEPKDPFLWLEDVTGDEALSWVKERNAASTGELIQGPEFAALNDRLLKILDSKERIPSVSKHGAWYYNFWRDDQNQRGLWRRTTLDEYRNDQPMWETVLDLDALSEAEHENWVWHSADFLRPGYQRALIHISRGGADADVVREFDVITKQFVKDGFHLPEAKSHASWKDIDTLWVGTDFGPDTLTKSGYPRITKQWNRGTELADAKPVFAGHP
jgi:prolyl oligopeptidase